MRATGEPQAVPCEPGICLHDKWLDERKTGEPRQESQADCLPHGSEHIDAGDDGPITPTGMNDSPKFSGGYGYGCWIIVWPGEVAKYQPLVSV